MIHATVPLKIIKTGLFLSLALFFLSTAGGFTQVIKGSFEFEGSERSYFVYVPKNHNQETKLPIVFNLHAVDRTWQFDATFQMNYTNMNAVADTAGFIAVYPNTITVLTMWDYNRDGRFFRAILDTLSMQYAIDRDRVYACGHSDGATMAIALTCQEDRFIAAAAANCLWQMPSNLNSYNFSKPIPVLAIHGTARSEFSQIEKAITTLANQNCCCEAATSAIPDINKNDNSTVEKTTFCNPPARCEVVFFKVLHGGAGWPSNSNGTSAGGELNRDIHGSVEMWNFFKKFKLSELNFPQHDLRVRSIIKGATQLPRFANLNPIAIVQNSGMSDATDVSVTIKIDSCGVPVYQDALVLNHLASRTDSIITFPNSHLLYGDSYSLRCYTTSRGEEYTNNDTCTTTIQTSDVIDDFETATLWVANYGWARYKYASQAHSGNYSLYSKGKANYSSAPTDTFTTVYFSSFNLSLLDTTAFLSFYTQYTFNEGDLGYLQVSVDSGETWQQLGHAFSGNRQNYEEEKYSLKTYVSAGARNFLIRFMLVDNPGNMYPAWFIDDIMLVPNNEIVRVRLPAEAAPDQIYLKANYPNPFNPATTIEYTLPQQRHVSLSIYNLYGQCVRTLVCEEQNAGTYSHVWNATDETGTKVSSGVYIYRIEFKDHTGKKAWRQERKMLLLK